jgi:hypothetical protein
LFHPTVDARVLVLQITGDPMKSKRWELVINLLFLSPFIIGLAVALLLPLILAVLRWIR